MSRKTRLLVVVGGFPPALNCGGPAVSLDNLCHALQGKLDCSVVTGDRDLHASERLSGIEEGWNERDGFCVLYLRSDETNLFRLQEITREIAPDVLYLNSLFSARFTVPFLKIGRDLSIPILLAPRGELFPHAFHKRHKKLPYLFFLRPFLKRRGVFYHATSDEEAAAIQKTIGITEDRIFRISEIPTLPKRRFPKGVKRAGSLRCLFLARIHPIKNLKGALDVLRNVHGEVTFDIYGPIEVPAYWDACRVAIEALPANVQVRYRGVVPRDALHETFSRYDVLLFPTLSENYGHVIPEALLSDCPVIISDRTPWTDVDEFGAGRAISLSEMDAFSDALQSIADMDADQYRHLTTSVRNYLQHKLKIRETVRDYVACFEALCCQSG